MKKEVWLDSFKVVYPVTLGFIPLGIACGMVLYDAGFSPLGIGLMSFLVYAELRSLWWLQCWLWVRPCRL